MHAVMFSTHPILLAVQQPLLGTAVRATDYNHHDYRLIQPGSCVCRRTGPASRTKTDGRFHSCFHTRKGNLCSKQLVGLVGWRGMVGSVLMERMQAEGDFDLIEPVFFSTSNAGGPAPAMATTHTQLKDAHDIAELAKCDIVITCQGGDYTNEVFPKIRAAGWNGHWIDAASALRMKDDAVIVLDPVNQDLIEQKLAAGGKNWIGGNCTNSILLMGVGSLFKAGLVEWVSSMTYQAASGGGANHMRELLKGMGVIHNAVADKLATPASAILEIDRQVAHTIRHDVPTEFFGAPLAGGLIPWIDSQLRQRPVQRRVEGPGRGEQNFGHPHHHPRRWSVRAHRRHALPLAGPDAEAEERPAPGRD